MACVPSSTLACLQVNRFLLDLVRVGEVHGIRFPREFALLIKQLLYFGGYQLAGSQMHRIAFSESRFHLS
jgi:hypothetical protein